ncbi:glycoside hydrolase family 88/105 protein [Massilia endophytica]|uniref:glycoside hydrolase family 88/105 protein n=1 Tax=Massilia endophytica TaxID=2899220 RepID=UPI001E528BF9|nr:glycoside hydrolase family 88 protein [Massilia endophytica]UGQ47299.1 glycoside hydrolase family 88 protein [Massilia endophytica]
MSTLTRALAGAGLFCLLLGAAQADGPYRNPDNKSKDDPGEGSYPVPYKMPVASEITEQLLRIRNYMDEVTPTRVVSRKTGQPIADLKKPVADAIFEPAKGDFGIMVYEMGVVHSGLMKAAAITGDQRFTAMTRRHLQFFADTLPYFKAQEAQFHLERANSFSRFLDPRALDDAGSMCAALMRARNAKIGPDLANMIATCSDWVANKQFRLPDGTMARKRPQAVSLWGDDMYMSIPALAEMGHYDDAVNNVLNMSKYLFNAQEGIYTHGWHANIPDAPRFYWARANGWAVLAMSDLLDVLPKDHPGYPKVLAQLRAALKGIAERQSGSGLWHQMIDRSDSYLETSASAMFVYVIAHAVNEGWVPPTTYGSVAQAGWAGLSTKINAKGQVEGTCVGTTLAGDQVYYYNRPTSVHALHGYGPMLMAGAEIIRLINNRNIGIEYRVRTYHYMPRDGGKTDYREHH